MSSHATRQKAYRERQRDSLAVLAVPVRYHDFIAALLRSTRLNEGEALDRRLVEDAAAKVLDDFITRWSGDE